jgi:membrane protein required for colicin V production
MNPLYIDVGLLVITILLLFGGFKSGFIKTAGNLLGLVLSLGLSLYGLTWLEDLLGYKITEHAAVFIVCFLLLSAILHQLLRWLVSALDLMRRMLSIIPFVGLLNSLLGLLLGASQAALLVGGLAYITVKYLPAGAVQATLLSTQSLGFAVSSLKQLGIL